MVQKVTASSSHLTGSMRIGSMVIGVSGSSGVYSGSSSIGSVTGGGSTIGSTGSSGSGTSGSSGSTGGKTGGSGLLKHLETHYSSMYVWQPWHLNMEIILKNAYRIIYHCIESTQKKKFHFEKKYFGPEVRTYCEEMYY